MKRFAIIGSAGFVAPRHMQAIKDVGGTIVAALDPSDSVGILDSYGFDVKFFTEFERFDRHLEWLRREGCGVDYVSICSPNYLHDSHIRFALRVGANAICEKPLVINPWNLEGLRELEFETGKRVYNVLQLRHHPRVIELRNSVLKSTSDITPYVNLIYNTPRGEWYRYSWKGNAEKSGGIATNIGIHLFDMLIWIFGKTEKFTVYRKSPVNTIGGTLFLKGANVDFELSIHPSREAKRSMIVEEKVIDFSDGFNNLHTTVYREILAGNGHGIDDARPAIELTHEIREALK